MRKKKSSEDESLYESIVEIKDMAATGKSVVRSMGSLKKMPFPINDLQFVPAQVFRIPLNLEEKVNTNVVIGPQAKRPLQLSSPIMISGMSFDATSKKVKLVISQAAARLRIAYNSGEGGLLQKNWRPQII